VLVSVPCRISKANKYVNLTTGRPCLDETPTRDRIDACYESPEHASESAISRVCPKVSVIRADLFSWQGHIRAIFTGSTEMLAKAAIRSS